MRKRIVPAAAPESAPSGDWLDLDAVADVEVTSEEESHPIESALLPGGSNGWRASSPGPASIRLLFDPPQSVQRIWVDFVETEVERTQEYRLSWSPDDGRTFHELVRQQWNFSPQGATRQSEDHTVHLARVSVLELSIIPDISGGPARASLEHVRLA